jgi:alpha-maltose-1-phosphate synthase
VAATSSGATPTGAQSLAHRAAFVMSNASPSLQVLLAHPGTQYSAQLARQLQRKGLLHRYWTSFALPENSLLERVLRGSMKNPPNWLGNRVVGHVPVDKIRTMPRLEVVALLRLKFGAESQIVLHKRNENFQWAIPDSEIAESDVVVGFDTSSSILADRAARAGRAFILDQTIAHPRSKKRVYELIKTQFPDWSDDLEIRADAVGEAEDAEHRKANRIVVASSFTKETLIENGVPAEKIVLNLYGVDLHRFSLKHQPREDRLFRFVFAGLVCARKGIPLLLQAWAALQPKDAELWIVGPITPTAAARVSSHEKIRLTGKVPNADLAAIMSESDVFVFPSYFEGFALVLLEAKASGLPVITTTATAGPDITTPGEDGWIIEPGNLDALVEAMRFCLNNRDRVATMGVSARQTAERFSWDAYGDRWVRILRDVCS